jgi:phenylacetate-coenzyme A ligase PaaK-like adenylate-forming protein
MLNYDTILSIDPYGLNKSQKEDFLMPIMRDLTRHHYDMCTEYHKIIDALGVDVGNLERISDLPFIPVRIFKEFELSSVDKNDIVKTMTSSGTTGAEVSKIFLDRSAAGNQTKTLHKIVSANIGNSRLPMIILDTSSLLNNRNSFSARAAGILGFSIFGRDKIYALNDDMELDVEALRQFLEKYSGQNILLFGFTFMIWQYFYQLLKQKHFKPDLSNGILIHGGGWKKLTDQAVSPERFKQALREACGIERVYEYYGMVEQTGTISMACERGHLHSSVFSDLVVRRSRDFSPAVCGERGIIQTLSVLPVSYPGHSLLTEDEGAILGEDDCACGRKGKYFRVFGRIKNAEIRGCSDSYASKFH